MSLSDDAKQQIQAAYSDWLGENNFKPRRPQREMIANIANFLGDIELDDERARREDYQDQLCILQAGTGTGKTLAYLIAAIVLAKALDKKVVVATATIALQEQLLGKDLPDLLASSSLEFSFAMAKGRSRYLCLSRLQQRMQEDPSAAALFPDEEPPLAKSALKQLHDVNDALVTGEWNGEYDSLSDDFDLDNWGLIAADRNACSGKKCSNYNACVLFKAREELRNTDLIIANHDLVLADLNLGGSALPPAEETIYVIDEAHHFPDKSRNHLSTSLSFAAEKNHLGQSRRLFRRMSKAGLGVGEFANYQSELEKLDRALDNALSSLVTMFNDFIERSYHEPAVAALVDTDSDGGLRFKHGTVPQLLQQGLEDLQDCYTLKLRRLQTMQDSLAAVMKDHEGGKESGELLESSFALLGAMLGQTQSALALTQDYVESAAQEQFACARWLRLREHSEAHNGLDIQLFAAPLSSGAILRRIFWSRCFAAILISATLSHNGRFEHFISQLGHGRAERAYSIQGQLNFEAATFHVPAMSSQATNPEAHTAEIVALIPELMAANAGTLVLFSSRRQMEQVAEQLTLQQELLVQGQGSKSRLLEKHRERVDQGQSSLLFGLASFAEGLDLPGAYCEQVIIAKLPFSVPDNPVDQALTEWVESRGGNGFADISLPEAAIRLMQACGRLLRHEQDVGRVSLLDRRIVEKSYGKQLLASLPPFRMQLD